MVCGVWLQVIHSDVIFVALVVIIILLFFSSRRLQCVSCSEHGITDWGVEFKVTF